MSLKSQLTKGLNTTSVFSLFFYTLDKRWLTSPQTFHYCSLFLHSFFSSSDWPKVQFNSKIVFMLLVVFIFKQLQWKDDSYLEFLIIIRTHNDMPSVVQRLFQMCLCINETHSLHKAKDPKSLESLLKFALTWSVTCWHNKVNDRNVKLTISNAH